MGASSARNHALSLAQGDYIQWLDADDLLAPDKVAQQLAGVEPGQTSRILISGSWGKFYDHPERAKFVPDLLWENLDPLEWMYRKVEYGLWMAIECWLVSRRLTKMAGPWNEDLSLGIDGEYFNRVLSFSEGVRFVSDARCICRRANFGISSSMTLNNSKLDSLAFVVLSSIKTLMSMEKSKRTRDASLKHLDRYSIYFFPDRPDIFAKMQLTAKDIGGELMPPRLRGRYRWLQRIFGYRFAKKAQFTLPTIRSLMKKNWERFVAKDH